MIQIYALVDMTGARPEVKYIGASVGPYGRLVQHINWAQIWGHRGESPEGREKAQWLYALLKKGLLPAVISLEEVSDVEQARKREKHFIAHYRAHPKHDLLNLTAGGEGLY